MWWQQKKKVRSITTPKNVSESKERQSCDSGKMWIESSRLFGGEEIRG
jgi:hypothetical protein